MAKKKKKPKKLATPTAGGVTRSKGGAGKKNSTSSSLVPLAKKVFRPRVLSTFAFGTSGLLAGLFTGLNHFPSFEQTAVLPKMMLLAAYLGDPHVDVTAGLITGAAGLIMGACLGFSALSDPKDLAASLLFSVVIATGVITFTGSIALAALGFLAGHAPAILAYLRLRSA